MLTQEDLVNLAQEINELIAMKGIRSEQFHLGITISREAYERIMSDLPGAKDEPMGTYTLASLDWSIQINCTMMFSKRGED